MDCVANTRRTKQQKTGVSLSIVPDTGQPGGAAQSGGPDPGSPDPGSPGPGGTEPAELVTLLRSAAAAGVPQEVLRVLESSVSVEDGLGRLAEAGLLPSLEQSLEDLLDEFSPLLEPGCDQLGAELCGTEVLGAIRRATPEDADVTALLLELTVQAPGTGTVQALAMLRVLAVVGPPEVRAAARAAGDTMVAGGLADLPWVRGLGSPRPGPCFGYEDDLRIQQSLVISFAYGRQRHALVVLIDHDLGGGVKDCFVGDSPNWLRAQYRQAGQAPGIQYRDYQAGQARAILERALAAEPCPVEPDQVEDVGAYLDLLRCRTELLAEGGRVPALRDSAGGRRAAPAAAGQDIHQLKITLRGSKPPIWRRLEVPSGASLTRLHDAIQRSFGWDGSHLWVFSTPAGEYGVTGHGLEVRSAASRKLSDVAPGRGERIRYIYDFGDDWEHDILVEGVLPAEPGVAYPRCTAGRRAAPPEDCGGIWGYASLLEILADPGSDEHEERLEWLGIESAADFDAAEFDLAAANKMLAPIARQLSKRPR